MTSTENWVEDDHRRLGLEGERKFSPLLSQVKDSLLRGAIPDSRAGVAGVTGAGTRGEARPEALRSALAGERPEASRSTLGAVGGRVPRSCRAILRLALRALARASMTVES
jgi:hypothetical protein